MPSRARNRIRVGPLQASAHKSDSSEENAGAPEIDAPEPEEIAERTAQQNKRRERQIVAVDHPLQAGKRHLQGFADAGQGQRHHAFAQHHHAASRNRGGNNENVRGNCGAAHH